MQIDWLNFNGDKVLVQPNKAEEKTSSGLIIPDTAKETPNIGIIVAKSDEVMSYDKGMEVMFGKNIGIEVNIAGEDFVLLKSGEIYCEVRRPATT